MGYWDDVRAVAQANRGEIEGDLDRARFELRRIQKEAEEAERRVETYERLLELSKPEGDEETLVAGLTLHEAMAEVLRGAHEGMLRAGDLAAEVNRRRLYTMRDGRPVEPQQIHARVGHYRHWFVKEGTFIKLTEGR